MDGIESVRQSINDHADTLDGEGGASALLHQAHEAFADRVSNAAAAKIGEAVVMLANASEHNRTASELTATASETAQTAAAGVGEVIESTHNDNLTGAHRELSATQQETDYVAGVHAALAPEFMDYSTRLAALLDEIKAACRKQRSAYDLNEIQQLQYGNVARDLRQYATEL